MIFQNLNQTKTQILLIQRKINNTYPAWERKNWSNPSVIESYQIPTNAHQDICRSSCVLCTWFYPHLRHECDASVDATFQTFKITLDIVITWQWNEPPLKSSLRGKKKKKTSKREHTYLKARWTKWRDGCWIVRVVTTIARKGGCNSLIWT